jgi:hypothetical protein|tara:strand:- start:216 stop:392 length:177 start_codon:yes stop_codon:yes gene_type:complete
MPCYFFFPIFGSDCPPVPTLIFFIWRELLDVTALAEEAFLAPLNQCAPFGFTRIGSLQ